jgi:hypothetical protein
VWADASGRSRRFSPREIDDAASEDTEVRFGFLAPRKADQVYQGRLEYLPDNWLDVSRATPRIKPGYKKAVPPSSLPPNVGHNSAPNWTLITRCSQASLAAAPAASRSGGFVATCQIDHGALGNLSGKLYRAFLPCKFLSFRKIILNKLT